MTVCRCELRLAEGLRPPLLRPDHGREPLTISGSQRQQPGQPARLCGPGGTASVTLRTLWPDNADGNASLAGVGDDIGSAAVGASWLAIPDRVQLVGMIDHELAGSHVRF
jgi:hypothetical protein